MRGRAQPEPDGEDAARHEGLEADAEPGPSSATVIGRDASRRIIARNQSPDVPFDRSINPYKGCEHGCVYCFARPTHAYLGLSPGLDFETRIFAKPDAAALLTRELAKALSADGEVEVAVAAEVDEFDFGNLPPVDLGNTAAPLASPASTPAAAPIAKPKMPVTGKSNKVQRGEGESGNQQLLLGIGLAIATMALVAVIALGVVSMFKPLPESAPKIKIGEDSKDGQKVIVIRPNS